MGRDSGWLKGDRSDTRGRSNVRGEYVLMDTIGKANACGKKHRTEGESPREYVEVEI